MTVSAKVDAASAVGEPAAFDEPRTVSAAEGYEWWAPTYDHAPNPLLAREERCLSALLTDLHSRSVLDLACGTGRWLERLMKRGCESGVGIDCSIAMLRIAGEKPAIRGRLARADCHSLPLPVDCFDLAICSFAVGHIHQLESVARELGRVTKAGADVFVTDLHSEAYARGWRVGFRLGGTAIQIETRPRTADEIVRVFGRNGFECKMHETLWLGVPERSIFERAGKLDSFVAACRLPAVLVCHFRRHGSPPSEN
jgi:ubiquinone/menaquinone biosynthesis C-methylase UbiE